VIGVSGFHHIKNGSYSIYFHANNRPVRLYCGWMMGLLQPVRHRRSLFDRIGGRLVDAGNQIKLHYIPIINICK
jgi:hypothetical protein